MTEFFISVELARGPTRISIEHITTEEQLILDILVFRIDYYNPPGFTTRTLMLINGSWSDLEVSNLHGFGGALVEEEIRNIGAAIARYMLLDRSVPMKLLLPVFPDPGMN